MVGVVQWLERQIVALDVVGSNPASPTNKKAWNLNDSGLLLLSDR